MKRMRALLFLVLVGGISPVTWGLSPQRAESPKLKIDGPCPVTVNASLNGAAPACAFSAQRRGNLFRA